MPPRRNIIRTTPDLGNPRKYGAKCDLCPLKGSKPVWGDGNSKALVAFVGEAPGREEVQASEPFIGRSGEMLENTLAKLQVSRKDIWVDNSLLCFPPGGDLGLYLQRIRRENREANLETHDPVDCCRPRLLQSLGIPVCKTCGKFVRGPPAETCRCATPMPVSWSGKHHIPVVVPLGNAALEALRGVSGITERRGYYEDMKKLRAKGVSVTPKGVVTGDVTIGGDYT